VTVPFSPVEGEFRAQQIAIDPDGTAYVVPSGMHERLRQAVASDREERDPKVALALSGWICLQTSGMTDRINVDAPDALTDAAPDSSVRTGSQRGISRCRSASEWRGLSVGYPHRVHVCRPD